MVLFLLFTVFFCEFSQDRIQAVKCALATACCLVKTSRCLPLLQWLQKRNQVKNPRSEVQALPVLMHLCSYFALLHHEDFLCYQRALIFACKRCNRLNPSYLYCGLPQTFVQTHAVTPRKTKIAPKKLGLKTFWDGVQNGAIGEFWGVHLFALYNPRYLFAHN